MAIDKAVDSKALDTLFENIGNAIREKDGTTALITPGNMPAKIRAIQTGVDTSDATVTADDMSYGVVAYGKDGKVYGGVPTIDGTSEKALGDSTVGFHEGLGKIQLAHRIPRLGMLFREGSTVILRASPSEFGDATAADVAKGKTFTSAAGLNVVGTAEGSSAADVTFEMYNHDFDNLAVVYMSKIDGLTQTTIPISSSMSITAIDGSMVALVDQDFGGNYIDLFPDNTNIPDAWVTQNITLFVASPEIDGMTSNINRA